MEILCGFTLVLERKISTEMSELSRLNFLEKFSANNFALSDAEDNTLGPLNRLRNNEAFVRICQKLLNNLTNFYTKISVFYAF